MKSSTQLKRMLNLVPYLQRKGVVEVAQVAREFATTPEEILSDLEVLQFCGLPEGYYDDLFHVDLEGAREDGYVWLGNADVLRRPRTLRREEATGLLVALELVAETAGGHMAAETAAGKLRRVLGTPEVPIDVHVEGGDPSLRRDIHLAIEAVEVIEIEHAGRSGVRGHVVEPVRLRTVGGFVYLDAWSRGQRDWRTYRLDRVLAVRPTGERFSARPGLPAPDEDWFKGYSEVTLTLAPEAAWVTEYLPVTANETADDYICVTLPVASRAWLTALLLRLGSLVLDCSQREILAEARSIAQQALLNYE